MADNAFATKSKLWVEHHPLLKPLAKQESVFWCNQQYAQPLKQKSLLGMADIEQASDRLKRFAPYLAKVFSDTRETEGIIESSLIAISKMQDSLAVKFAMQCPGSLWLKCDSHLPIAGSVKARGGIYEVLKYAETIALHAGLLSPSDNYLVFASSAFKRHFAKYSISVGSTGNLGLSIGIIGAALGFKVSVHMSGDAKQWKRQLLREKGVHVIEYADDYSVAVAQGRLQAQSDNHCHFIDDENSADLFLGYAVAALRLKEQLNTQQITVDSEHPLFIYLPCGVGGAPGGIAFGLKQVFGDNVHCFFAEPSASPCMLLGMYTQLHEKICIQDIGLKGHTCADGLAVGRPSAFVGKIMQALLSGCYTLDDGLMYQLLAMLADTEQLHLEPSALAGVIGMQKLFSEGQAYIVNQQLESVMHHATHIAWATGGNMVPELEFRESYTKGAALLRRDNI